MRPLRLICIGVISIAVLLALGLYASWVSYLLTAPLSL